MKLEIELIPATSFFTNVRSIIPEHWDDIRKDCYKKASYKCEICGGVGPKWPVECHEVWEYKKGIQKLIRLIALCPNCHEAKHVGLASMRGRTKYVVTHLMKINEITEKEAKKQIQDAFSVWEKRSLIQWKLDISILDAWRKNET